MQEVCRLMGIHKVNTTAYHPPTDGLVERSNRTLIDMLAETVEKREEIGMSVCLTFCLHTEPVCRTAPMSCLSICFMAGTPSCQLMLLCAPLSMEC